jgi:hypothetical protein
MHVIVIDYIQSSLLHNGTYVCSNPMQSMGSRLRGCVPEKEKEGIDEEYGISV